MGKLQKELECGIITEEQYRSIITSTYGWLKHANTHNLQVKLELGKLMAEIKQKIREERKIRKAEKEKLKKQAEEKQDNGGQRNT